MSTTKTMSSTHGQRRRFFFGGSTTTTSGSVDAGAGSTGTAGSTERSSSDRPR